MPRRLIIKTAAPAFTEKNTEITINVYNGVSVFSQNQLKINPSDDRGNKLKRTKFHVYIPFSLMTPSNVWLPNGKVTNSVVHQ